MLESSLASVLCSPMLLILIYYVRFITVIRSVRDLKQLPTSYLHSWADEISACVLPCAQHPLHSSTVQDALSKESYYPQLSGSFQVN